MSELFHMVEDGEGGNRRVVRAITPVHRRCDELTPKQIDRWVDVWEDYKNYDALDALKVAYEIVTGEDHP